MFLHHAFQYLVPLGLFENAGDSHEKTRRLKGELLVAFVILLDRLRRGLIA
jgi:hypothetical protein